MKGNRMNKELGRCKQFLIENGWKLNNDDEDYESYYKAMCPTVDISKDAIYFFVSDNGDYLYLPVNYYALIGALIEYHFIDMGYKSVQRWNYE